MAPKVSAETFGDWFDLPMIDGKATVSAALDRMVDANCAGVVVNLDGIHYLHSAEAVTRFNRKIGNPQILPSFSLANALQLTGLHLPVARYPFAALAERYTLADLAELTSDYGYLVRQGIVRIVQGKLLHTELGGILFDSDNHVARILASHLALSDRLGLTITTCDCTFSPTHKVRPDDLYNGLCPEHGVQVDCR